MDSYSLPHEIRQLCKDGSFTSPTPGLALGFVQANLVVLPYSLAFEFLLFCQRNPKPCPVLDVTDVGSPEPKIISPGADIRTDLPRYRVFRYGELVEETTDITPFWRNDLVAFLIGCSFSFENAMLNIGLPVRHIEEQKNVPMYKTDIECMPTGAFSSPLVVSMRPLRFNHVVRAVEVTSQYYKAHGSPIHIGNPETIGIKNLEKPDYGDAVKLYDDEIPVFWACGVTTQTAILRAKPELAITHSPGHMFVSDLRDDLLMF
ncbi:MAG: putative hydro-lyase [Limnospira sp. PMC 894.15]|uniref:Hydro-lyase n=1 Tax=Limnospira fusiformis PMC 851.14 TaxID=2219512 RepID=A0ABU9EMR7_LIMFS|nr:MULTISPECIES: putative hydro-lyase [unclassified Limnospira]MDT9191026.1 putative hydro-lyase [Limnospira sp. PMC 894.15]MDT9236945.1 putative hydro-lyase [Limnospira sp. PMC 917.15]MDT9277834.1 putative hydro-lyase [Limnospira sp. PMC 737.11]